MIFVLMLELLSLKIISGEQCEDIICSNVIDNVCGMVKSEGSINIKIYQNICHLEKIRCSLKDKADVSQVSDVMCGSEIDRGNSRRLYDFSIVGAYQACNHTCPTYCIDTYKPACAQIWNRNRTTSTRRVMVNHCHIDLFSCVVGVNVTILPLSKCYVNGNNILFMKHVASLKSLKLISRRSYDGGTTEWIPQYVIEEVSLDNIMSEEEEAENLPFLSEKLRQFAIRYLLNK